MYKFASIVFPVPTPKPFTYSVPEELQDSIELGQMIQAPFGPKNPKRTGYVVELFNECELSKLKSISKIVSETPIFSEEILKIAHWIAEYYRAGVGEVLRAAYPFSSDQRAKLIQNYWPNPHLPDDLPKMSKAGKLVWEYFQNNPEPCSINELIEKVGVSSGAVKTLVKNGYLIQENLPVRRLPEFYDNIEHPPPLNLTSDQENALTEILRAIDSGKHKTFLLHGVTGSGKTEVYLEALRKTMEMGKRGLVLIPEISLTPQTVSRFQYRFGDKVGVYHSALGKGERYDEWCAAREGISDVVIGTRSAIFAPLENIGLIVVDEEHDGSYKQVDPAPRYNARDIAVLRGMHSNAVVVLGSATPSMESLYNASKGKYTKLLLPERAVEHGLPTLNIIDMRGRGKDEIILSDELTSAIERVLERNEQAILFLNRRGFATSMLCRNCGQSLMCPNCSVSLVYHFQTGKLMCHHCGYKQREPKECPICKNDWLRYTGIGTEKVVEVINDNFPNARYLRIDHDTTRRKGSLQKLLLEFSQRKADIIVGTQIIAKGLDFPGVSLVGVIQADTSLFLPDFRTGERTFTLITQVSGRAGRGETPGEVYLQTFTPKHYAVKCAINHDFEEYYRKEIQYRKIVGLPPISRLVNILIEASKDSDAKKIANSIGDLIYPYTLQKRKSGIKLFGPVEAPIYRLRGMFRWQVAIAGPDHHSLKAILDNETLKRILNVKRKGLRIVVDVDPINLL